MKQSILALTLALSMAPAFAEGAEWFADYDTAMAAAKAADKDLLVDFMGSDWCHWCVVLDDEVFSKQEWLDAVAKDYVLVALDFPRGPEAQAAVPNAARNRELSELHEVAGFPTVVLIDTDGVAFARTGYRAGGPAAYLEHMATIAANGKDALARQSAVLDAFGSAQGNAKWKAWDDVAALFGGLAEQSPFRAGLRDEVRWGFENDAKNQRGKRLQAAAALIKAGLADAEVLGAVPALDPKNANGLRELVLDRAFAAVRDESAARAALVELDLLNDLGFRDSEMAFRMNFTAAQWCAGPIADSARRVRYATRAKDLGTEDEQAMAELKKLIG